MPLSVRTPPVVTTRTMSAACERDEAEFIFVAATARLELPFCSTFSASAAELTLTGREAKGGDDAERSEVKWAHLEYGAAAFEERREVKRREVR